MKRTSVNPYNWGLKWHMDQGELVEGLTRVLRFSGQAAVEPDSRSDMGIKVVHPGDTRAQLQTALSGIDSVLTEAGMTRKNILYLRFYTTDMDGFMANYDVYADWIAPTGLRPPQTLLGVHKLFLSQLTVEIEAVAGE